MDVSEERKLFLEKSKLRNTYEERFTALIEDMLEVENMLLKDQLLSDATIKELVLSLKVARIPLYEAIKKVV